MNESARGCRRSPVWRLVAAFWAVNVERRSPCLLRAVDMNSGCARRGSTRNIAEPNCSPRCTRSAPTETMDIWIMLGMLIAAWRQALVSRRAHPGSMARIFKERREAGHLDDVHARPAWGTKT